MYIIHTGAANRNKPVIMNAAYTQTTWGYTGQSDIYIYRVVMYPVRGLAPGNKPLLKKAVL